MNCKTQACATAQARPLWATKWWMRVKPSTDPAIGSLLYCPWWAHGFDFLHVCFFGKLRLAEVSQK